MAEPSARRVLVVDDEPDIRDSIKALLEMLVPDVRVQTAGTGGEGLRLLEAERPDLVLSDFRMPGMNGIEFLTAAQGVSPDTMRILMTAFPDIEAAGGDAAAARLTDVLTKPFEPAELAARVAAALEASARDVSL